MTRRERHGAILELIKAREIPTQAALVEALREQGVDVVQSTVSRDIGDLGLIKVRGSNGLLVYAEPGARDSDRMRELQLTLQRWLLTIRSSGNMVVIGTLNGYADPLAEAMDEADHPLVLGTLAGENTVFVVAVEGASGAELCQDLRELMASTEEAR